jgi:predicted acyltransferase
MQPSSPPPPALPNRLSSLDAYRGFVMFLMLDGLLRIKDVAKAYPDSPIWKQLVFHTDHVAWAGCSLHDLIQPSFSFLVGAALPFSIASRKAKGQSFGRMLFHAAWRALLLVALGIFLRSTGAGHTRFVFVDTLTQIGLGYVFLFLLGFTRIWWQLLALVVILVGYWGAFAWYPAPPDDFDYSTRVKSQEILKEARYTGFASHWNPNTNAAWAVDDRFLSEDGRRELDGGGYCTLNFIPTLGTMILGLIAGGWLKSDQSKVKKVLWLVVAGGLSLAAGFLLDKYGICPSVKRIWTPAWTLYSGGWCFFFLALFYSFADGLGWRVLFFPLIVIGMNSIAIYCLDHLTVGFVRQSLQTHLPAEWFNAFGETWAPLVQGAAIIFVFWLILYWMYRNKIFVRI